MGWNIGIGEAVIVYEISDRGEETCCIIVEGVEHIDAPEFFISDISGKGNFRYPSYDVFHNWAYECGLGDLFFHKYYGLQHGSIDAHPITEFHLRIIRHAKRIWEMKHPGCQDRIPYLTVQPKEYEELYRGNKWKEMEEINNRYDWVYARIIWFEFWFDYAIKNCKQPIIYFG